MRAGLDDRVFDVLQLKAPDDPKVKFDARWRQVTIRHLLQHTGGWDRTKSFDPMFRSPAGPEFWRRRLGAAAPSAISIMTAISTC